MFAAALLWPCILVHAQEAVSRASLTNYDRRVIANPAMARAAVARPEQRAAEVELQKRTPGISIDFEPIFGSPKWIRPPGGKLTGAGGEGGTVTAATAKRFDNDPDKPVKAFLEEHRGLFRHGPEVLAGARKHRDHTNEHGWRTVAWEQQVDGIPVFDSVFVAHSGRGGELLALSSQFLPEPERAADRGTANRKARAAAPVVSAEQALHISAQDVGETISEIVPGGKPAAGTLKQSFEAKPLPGDAGAALVWLPLDSDTLRLCWEIELNRRQAGERFRFVVDAETGTVLVRRKLTVEVSEVQYRVFTSDSPAPFSPGLAFPTNTQAPVVPRHLLTLSNLNSKYVSAGQTNWASPLGWINDGVMETRGNNVDAHLDRDANDRADMPRIQGTTNAAGQRVFDFPLDLKLHPTNYSGAAMVQLFFWCNFMHDRLYELGFTESAGNFQKDNFGRGGADNDPMYADAQDGSDFNNANYTPTRDGSSPKIQMYLFNSTTPVRDGDLDADVVLHEYAHGLTDRSIGSGVGISQLQTYGLGEGWSDFYALAFLAEYGDDLGGNYPMGGYVTHQFNGLTQNYYYGIRRYPYSTNLNINPLTFKDIDISTASSHPGIPINPIITSTGSEVHRQGEIWTSMLWDLRAALLRKYAPTNATEYTNVNMRILGYVTRGVQLCPPNPNFIQARDAIFLAIQNSPDGQSDTNEAWFAFARRGLGVGASSPDSSTTIGVVESYGTPLRPEFSAQPIVSLVGGPEGGPFVPEAFENVLFNGGVTNVFWAAGASVPWLRPATNFGVVAPNSFATNRIMLTSAANTVPPGTHPGNIFYTNIGRSQVITLSVVLLVQTNLGDLLLVTPTDPFQSEGPRGGPFNPAARDYQLLNAGSNTLAWSAFTTNSWLSLSRSTGVIAGGQFGALSILINANANALTNGLYSGRVMVTNRNTGTPWALDVSLRVAAGDYFVEDFTGGQFDMAFKTLTLVPDLSNDFYRACQESAAAFPVDPAGGIPLALADDSYQQIVLTNGRQVSIFGISSNAIYVGANGNVTFDPGPNIDHFYTGLGEFFSQTRVAPLFADLNPAAGGTVSWKQLPDRLVVTWQNVPEFGVPGNLNSAQVEMWFDGILSITWLNARISDPNNSTLYSGVTRSTGSTVAPPGFVESNLSGYEGCTAEATLLLPLSVNEGESAVQGTIFITVPLTNDLLVTFTSDDTNEIVFYDTLIIPAGQTVANFGFDAVDDGVADGTQRAMITAHFLERSASASLLVHDAQSADLTVNVASSGTEGALVGAGGRVTASVVAAKPITVSLLSENTNRARVPLSVVIPVGASSVDFDINLLENDLFDGPANVVIEASVLNWAGDFDVIRVQDNENRALAISLPAEVTEGRGTITNAGTISFHGRPVTNVVLALQSNHPELISVPPFVTNFAGQTSVKFNLFVGNNSVTNSFDVAKVTVVAAGFIGATGSVILVDDERPFAPTGPAPMHLAADVPRDTELSWQVNPSAPPGTTYDVFLGTNADLSLLSPIATTSGSSVPLPRHLDPDTTYYWQVLARLSPFPSEQSAVWQFRTVNYNLLLSGIPSPQYRNDPFPLTIIAADENDLVVTNYAGPVTLTNSMIEKGSATIVISEIDVNGLDRVEFQNVTDRPVNIAGWKIALYDWQTWPAPLGVFTVPQGSISQPGEVFHLRNFPPQLPPVFFPGSYPMFAIPAQTAWNNNVDNNPIAIMLLDQFGQIVDFFCAASTEPSSITSPRSVTAADWSGLPVPVNLESTLSYHRVGSSDHNSLVDWLPGARGIGTNNPALSLSFSNTVSVPFATTPIEFVGGVASLDVTMLDDARQLTFHVSDVRGRTAASNPFDVVTRNDLLLRGSVTNNILVNAPFAYTFTATNYGPEPATLVTFVDVLGSNVSFGSATASQGACSFANGVVTCDLGTLAGGTVAKVTIVVSAFSRGIVTNFASIVRAEPDGNLLNNSVALATSATYPQVSILDATNAEPSSAGPVMTFNLRLSAPNTLTSSVAFATSDGTASAGLDYEGTNGVVTFLPGVTNQTFSVPIHPDAISESNETVVVNLSTPINLEINRATGSGTITDNDTVPRLSIDDVAVIEGDSGTKLLSFNVRLSAASGKIVTCSYVTANGTALAGLDYEESYGWLVLRPGTTNVNINVPIFGDFIPEIDKTFFLNLVSPGNASFARPQGLGTIVDDDVAPLASFSFAPIHGSNYAGLPVPVTVTARDGDGGVATDFNGPATLLALSEQRPVTIGSNILNWNLPFATSFHDARVQSIYTSNELGGAGRIMALALDVALAPGQLLSNFTIRMRPSPEAQYSFPAWQVSGWTTNYQHDTFVGTNGWTTFTFATPFEYSGHNHLMIDLSFNNSSFSVDGMVRSTATVANRSIYLRTDSAYGDPLEWGGENSPSFVAIARVPNVRLIVDRKVPLSAVGSGHFVNGVWSGAVTLNTLATNVVLRVVDDEGHFGDSNPFALVGPPQLQILRIQSAALVRFLTLPGAAYVVESSATPEGPWEAVSGITIGTGGYLEYSIPAPFGRQFYRLRVGE